MANEVELYYARPGEDKLALLRTFTNEPANFKHSDLIKQIENVDLLASATAQASSSSSASKK